MAIARRRDERAARRLVWQKAFAAARDNPAASGDELFGIVAADLQDDDLDGFDIGLLLQILMAVLPLIQKLFNR